MRGGTAVPAAAEPLLDLLQARIGQQSLQCKLWTESRDCADDFKHQHEPIRKSDAIVETIQTRYLLALVHKGRRPASAWLSACAI